MKVTIDASIVALRSLSELVHRELPFDGAMNVRALRRQVAAKVDDYEQVRQKLLDLHAAKNEDGSRVTKMAAAMGPDGVPVTQETVVFANPEAEAAFYAALGDLLKTTWECDTVLTREDFCGKDPKMYKPREIRGDLMDWLGDLYAGNAPAAVASK